MKTLRLAVLSLIPMLAASSMHAQQTFKNLNFEKANPVIDPNGMPYPYAVNATSALPNWTVYLGNVQQTDVLQNLYAISQASVDIFGPNYPAAGPPNTDFPGTIDGQYSVLLQQGNYPFSPAQVTASIAQTGLVPVFAQSMDFLAWTTPYTQFSVSLNGINLTPVALGVGPNYTTLYGVDVSAFSGQTATLEFSSLGDGIGATWLGLDDIAFSNTALTPEPNIVALSAMGGLFFGARKWFARH